MDFKSFSDISEYVREHTLDEMISYALRNSFYTHGYRYSSGKLNDQIDELNKLTSGKYTIVLGDTIKEEVTDIKQNLDRYGELHETLLVDDLSKKTLIELLAYRLTRNEKYIISAYCEKSQQYFDNSLVFFEKDCVYVDCGGFDGYTAAEFMLNCPYYKKVYIYEPIEQYFDLCRKNLAHLEMSNIILRNAAVYSSNTTLTFSKNVAGNSKLDASGKIMVNGVTLDNDISEQIDFIKMDIEGSEKEALLGAKRHINQEAPILAICIYHNPGDLWEIPFLIKELNKNYDLYLRHHTTGTDETVIYAVYKDKTKLKSNTGQKSIINTETEVECYRINYKAKISEIMTLREAKKYLMYQIINMQASEQLEKDTNEELRDWNRQLEEGKNI